MLRHTRAPGPRATDKAEQPRPTEVGSGDLRPHVFALAFGLLDAHVSGVDYLDTAGGEELMRLYHQRQAHRQVQRQVQRPRAA